jgi:hypothetical protein
MPGYSEPQTGPLGILWSDDPSNSAGARAAAGRPVRWVVAGPMLVIVVLAVLSLVMAPVTMLVAAVAGVSLVVVLLFGDVLPGRTLVPRTATVLAVLATAATCAVLALPGISSAVNGAGATSVRPSIAELQRTRDLSGRDLRGRSLNGIDLSGHDLSGADLRGASLRGATLVRADLRGAKVTGADLSGADLSAACLVNVVLSGATTAGILTEGAVTVLPATVSPTGSPHVLPHVSPTGSTVSPGPVVVPTRTPPAHCTQDRGQSVSLDSSD